MDAALYARKVCFFFLWGATVAWSQSQNAAPPLTPFALTAYQANGARLDTDRLRGNVTVVFYWDSSCAVCLDSLPELRANLTGWRNKPFSLLVVNVDRRPQDWLAYEGLLARLQPPLKGYLSVHQDAALASPTRLPLTLVLDAKANVVQRIEGRVAPEVWDTVAGMLN